MQEKNRHTEQNCVLRIEKNSNACSQYASRITHDELSLKQSQSVPEFRGLAAGRIYARRAALPE
jgi:hypothetical protein